MAREVGSIKVDSEKVEQLFASKTVELKTKVSVFHRVGLKVLRSLFILRTFVNLNFFKILKCL